MAILLVLCLAYNVAMVMSTPLDDYVNKPDSTYTYNVTDVNHENGYTFYVINMTSQTWEKGFQSRPIWWHIMYVIIPDRLKSRDTGYLYIAGNKEILIRHQVTLTTEFAVSTGTICAVITLVPNEPIIFKNDPDRKSRVGNSLLAWTWKSFIESEGKHPNILLHLPMTKACVRALDTIYDLSLKQKQVSIDKFLVSGLSKRGWTAWNLASVDKRVIAVAPIVMDMLHVVKNLHHVYRALGGWSFAFKSFYDVDITKNLDAPYTEQLGAIVDPIYYKDVLKTKPKYIISAGGDELFMVDDTILYFNEIKGNTYLRMVPKADHSTLGFETSILSGIKAFYSSVIKNVSLPQISWTLNTTSTGGMITLKSNIKPLTVSYFYGTTLDGKRKDFRMFIGCPGNTSLPWPHHIHWYENNVTQT
ncbi:hypothetical protein ACF0H5_000506 [Mactra antiquata]